MTEHLVNRLRFWAGFGYGAEASKCLKEAADLIESRVLAERKPIYQAQHAPGMWMDCTEEEWARYGEEWKRIVFTHPTPDDASIHARIPKGWRVYTADFSCSGALGSVTLKRDADGEKWWLSLTDEQPEATSLYEFGRGMTIEKALAAAIDRAMQDKEPK